MTLYTRTMTPLLPHLKPAFFYDNLYPCFLRCMLKHFEDMMIEENGTDGVFAISPAGLAKFFSILLYSRKATEKRKYSWRVSVR